MIISPYKAKKFKVTSIVGYRTHPITGAVGSPHYGLDCVAQGDDTIVAVRAGTVVQSRIVTSKLNTTWQWGNYVAITDALGYTIYYCHMSKRLVSVGDKVKAGDAIGIEGATGQATGKHLHIEERKGTVKCNLAGDRKICNIADVLGIDNKVGTYTAGVTTNVVNTNIGITTNTILDTYTKSGFVFMKAKNFAIRYHDNNKRVYTGTGYSRYANAGFFGNYVEGSTAFTLPAANLYCDIDTSKVNKYGLYYLNKWTKNNGILGKKLRYSCIDNNDSAKQFKNKKVSTLIVPTSGEPYVDDYNELPKISMKYAISGVPTIRNGDDVDYYNYVAKQGWKSDCVRNTSRVFLGVRDGEIWVIVGETKAKSNNYIYGMYMYNILKDEGFDDVIGLDGGGSYYFKNGSKISTPKSDDTNRRINTVITF